MDTFIFFAYLDAGTGSVIIQALIALIAAVSYFFRHRVIVLFHKLFKKDKKKAKDE